jgi:dienelactone hydrolase
MMKKRWGNQGKKGMYLLLILSALLHAEGSNAQLRSAPVNAKIDLVQEPEDLNVFQQWLRWNNPGTFLINYLNKQAFSYYDRRDGEIARLKTVGDWHNRQARVRDILAEIIGAFPEKTPLNPRITGIIKKDGYRIEKVIFESFAGSYVTGCLYIPERVKGRIPAILNVIGHNQEAFRNPLYQAINYNLVKKGMIVLAIDPPGQGEHVQNYDPAVKFSSIGYTVIEHCYFGNQCFLSGYSCAKYFIWDGIRAIDYLITRKEVDPERIGVTGFSGGGTVTSYIAALDDRVKVSIPCSWANASRRLLETKGAPDAEALLYHGTAKGITHEDLLELRAPKPTLLTFVSRDEYLCLQGAREAFQEAKKTYELMGHPENLEMVEDDSKHWMTPKIRLKMYSFFMKHFNLQGDPSELEADILPVEDLKVTPTGQVSTFLGGKLIFDDIREETSKLIVNLEKSRQDIGTHLDLVKIKAKELSGFIAPDHGAGVPFINGRYQREGYSVGKYAIAGEGDYAIPILLFVPDDGLDSHAALVYVHPAGKDAEAKAGGEIEKLVRKGYVVAAVDVLGIGETKNTAARGLTDGYTAVLIGRSVVGIQAGDLIRVVDFLKAWKNVDPVKIGAVGINEMCLPLLHAAAFDASIGNMVLIGSPVSFRSIAMNRLYHIGFTRREGGDYWHPYELDFSWGVAGALTAYDLPDLIGCIAPRKVVLAGLKDQMLEPASDELVNQELNFPRSAYSLQNAPDNLKVQSSYESLISLVDWSFR